MCIRDRYQDSLYFFLGNQQLNIKVKNAFVSYNDKRNKGVLYYVQGEIMEYGKKEISNQANTKKNKKTFRNHTFLYYYPVSYTHLLAKKVDFF